jgi:hypothetical protein
MPLDLIVRHFCPADGTQKGWSKFLLQLKKKDITQNHKYTNLTSNPT